MSSTISAVSSAPTPVHGHHHHRGSAPAAQADPFSSSSAASSAAATPASDATPPGTGLQKFASELQSILLSAQSGQPAPSGTTAGNPATATDPAGVTDPTAPSQGGPIRHLADRLQSLLGGGPGQQQTSSAAASQPGTPANSLESVLNTLQQTLQQRLANYGSQSAAAPASSLVA